MILSKKQITKALIWLHGCAGWSVPVLFANPLRQVFLWGGPYYNEAFTKVVLCIFNTCVVSGNPNKYNTEQSTDNITTRHHFLVLRNMYSSRIAVTIVSTIVNIVLRPINTIIVKKRTLQKAGVEKWLTAAGNDRKTNPVSETNTQKILVL